MDAFALQTLIAIETLPGGSVLAYPIVDPSLSSYGAEADVVAEQRLFLSEHLASQPPATVARFALPAESQPQPLILTLPTVGLPRALRAEIEFDLHVIVVPHADARWVLVPSLKMTVHVAAAEELEGTVRREVGRQLHALGGTLGERLQILPPDDLRFEWFDLEIEQRASIRDGTRKLRRELQRKRESQHALELLASVARPVHSDDELLKGALVVGRETEVAALETLLGSERRQCVALVGGERVGKTAVLHQWIRERHKSGQNVRVYETSGAQLVAGMSGLGQWQERLERVLKAAETVDAILFFDDMTDLFGGTGTSHVDLPGGIKPALDEARVRIIGELTPEAADRLQSKHEGFFRHFHDVGVSATSTSVAHESLLGHRDLAKTRDVVVNDGALEAILSLSERYLPYRELPGKAVDLLHSVVRAAEHDGVREDAPIGAARVHEMFSRMTGIPEVLLREDVPFRSQTARTAFSERVIGQQAAVDAVVDTLCVVKSALGPGDKPLATFLFVGPTGVGKTELARTLAIYLYGSSDRLVRFDMSEYSDPGAGQRLLYGGAGSGDGELTRRVRQQPFGVVLLDEIEKAHRSVFDLLLQVAGEGRLTDARGRTAYFHNTILIMTSNLGATHSTEGMGIGAAKTIDTARYTKAVRETFRPELVNRFDRVIPFSSLAKDQLHRIVDLQISDIGSRPGLRNRGGTLLVDEDAAHRLADDGFHEAYGARALRRHLESALAAPVAEAIAQADENELGEVQVSLLPAPPRDSACLSIVDSPPFHIRVTRADTQSNRGDAALLTSAAELRRTVHLDRSRQSVVDSVAREAFLTARLAHLHRGESTRRRKKTSGAELAAMSREQHVLAECLSGMDEASSQILELEELLVGASFERQALPDSLDDLEALGLSWRQALLRLYLELDPRHAITVLCQEMDTGRTLDGWLLPLLRYALPERGWTAILHVHDESADEPYGPALTAEQGIQWLTREGRPRAVIAVRLSGPHVGTLVSVECGLHRYFGIAPLKTGSHHVIRRVAMRAKIAKEEFHKNAFEVTRPRPFSELVRESCVRWTDERETAKLPKSYIHIPLEEYWTPRSSDELALRSLIATDSGGDTIDRAYYTKSPLDQT